MLSFCASLIGDVNPAVLARAPQDAIADDILSVPVCEGGEGGFVPGGAATSADVIVDGAVDGCMAMAVREPFGMASGVSCVLAHGFIHQVGVFDQDLVRPVAVAYPEFVGALAVPSQRCARAVDLHEAASTRQL